MPGPFNNLARIADRLERGVAQIVEEATDEAAAEWRRRAPVRSGRYRDGVTAVMTGPTSGLVYNDTPYGPELETGTRHMSPRPSMHPAYEVEKAAVPAKVSRLARSL